MVKAASLAIHLARHAEDHYQTNALPARSMRFYPVELASANNRSLLVTKELARLARVIARYAPMRQLAQPVKQATESLLDSASLVLDFICLTLRSQTFSHYKRSLILIHK